MVAFKREDTAEYRCRCITVPLSDTANAERTVPLEWMNEERNGMNEQFTAYALPLIQKAAQMRYENGLPRFAKLKKIRATAE